MSYSPVAASTGGAILECKPKKPTLHQGHTCCCVGHIFNRSSPSDAIFAGFEEALLERSVTAISAARSDKLAYDIIHKATDHTLEQFLIRGNERVYKANQDIWLAAIEEARREGVIKPNLSDDRIIEIIASIHALLLMRDDPPAKQRAFLQDVLLPAIVVAQEG